MSTYGAPNLEAARPVAREQIMDMVELCADHDENTLLAVSRELTDRDYWLVEQVKPVIKEKGLMFVGLDVIGDYITEINVTSPTCVREIDDQRGTDIAGLLMDAIERRLVARG